MSSRIAAFAALIGIAIWVAPGRSTEVPPSIGGPEPSKPALVVPTARPAIAAGCTPIPALAAPAGLQVTLEIDKPVVAVGEPLRMTLILRNQSGKEISWRYGIVDHDYWVTDAKGVVWVASHGKIIDRALAVDGAVYAGGYRSRSGAYYQQVCGRADKDFLLPAGRYVIRGMFWVLPGGTQREGGWWSNPVPFEIR